MLFKSPYTLYDLCLYLERIVRNLSRYRKYTLGADLRDTSSCALKLVVQASARREKVPVLLHVSRRRRKEDGPAGWSSRMDRNSSSCHLLIDYESHQS